MTWAIFCNSKETQKQTKTIWSVGGMVTARNESIGFWKYTLLMFEQYSVAQKTKTYNVNLQRCWKNYSSKPNHCFVVIYYTDNFSNILWMWKWMWNNHDRFSIKNTLWSWSTFRTLWSLLSGFSILPFVASGSFSASAPTFSYILSI